jgi:chromosome segregation ATPase
MKPEPAVIAEEVRHPTLADHHNPAAPQTELTAGLPQHYEQSSRHGSVAAADADEDPLSVLDGYNSDSSYNSNSNSNMSLYAARKPAPPHLSLAEVDPDTRATSASSHHDIATPDTNKPLPRSPGSTTKLGSFFGWGSPSPSTSDFSDKGNFSPIPSPFGFSRSSTLPDASPVTTLRPTSLLEAPRTSFGSGNSREYVDSFLATPPALSTAATAEIEEMEDELKAISAELAASIRREMDLEDLVDRLQAERDNPTSTANKRTSDYFSDSGYSSAKFSEYDQSREEIEKIQRRSEQEKAQIKLDLTSKVQDERSKRAQLDAQIKELSERASQIDLAHMNNMDANGRIKDLENTCETLRRKLAEEREVKDNFEDLFSALKGELQDAANERDNLRDEIVPQLRARVEGLEGQASELEKMTYEATKMQQELQALKSENDSLKQTGSMGSIAEENVFQVGSRLSRSNSITGPPSTRKLTRPSSGLSRSKSVKTTESREVLSDRLKDVEEQRDALHRALRALLERQECQNRENEKKIKALEMERDRLLTDSPQKAGFVKEVSNLREEINILRRRSEEALEQKWQVEKGLAGLKMDLDRAEQEIASLRSLLQEKDILIPEALARSSASSDGQYRPPVTSMSLVTAYSELQEAYTSALDRIKEMSTAQDEKTQLAIEILERSLSSTISDRDMVMQEASAYKAQLDIFKAGEKTYLESEKALADELQESARRVEELSAQVRQQLASNQNLRQRLTDTVARGEAEQKANADRIASLQKRLHVLEEQVVAAQTASEERVARHEEEIAAIKDGHNRQLSRLSGNLRSPRLFPPKSPMSPLFASPTARSPRLSATRSGPAMSVSEETQVAALKERVAELEQALAQADLEMEEVVGRMNAAQIEVLQLQEEREAVMSQTRKLERELQAEKVKAFEDRFKSLQS